MSFQEFPKALYRGDEFTAVPSADAEAELRAQGWHDFGAEPGTDQTNDAPKSKRTARATPAPADQINEA